MNIKRLLGERLFYRVAGYLIARARRTPYFHLPGYMDRFWLAPFAPKRGAPEGTDGCYTAKLTRNPFVWLCQRVGVSVRVHVIKRSDEGPYYHDHPASFFSVILRGSYFEVTPKFTHGILDGFGHELRAPGDAYFKKYNEWHRVSVPHIDVDHGNGDVRDEPVFVYTLFIMFRWRQRWGYLVQPEHKKYYRDVHKEAAAKLPEIE